MVQLASPVILLILLSGYLVIVLSELGTKSKLYNGTPVDNRRICRNSSQFPYMVDIRLDGEHYCGGVLITTEVILTASHCFKIGKLSRYLVRAGHIYTNDYFTDNVQSRKIQRVVKYNNSNIKQDIALVKVKRPFINSTFVGVINLPTANQWNLSSGHQVKALGWGITEYGYMANFLEMIDLHILPQSNCSAKIYPNFSSDLLCGLDVNMTAMTCLGDSGGPFVLHSPNNSKTDVIIGVISLVYLMPDPAGNNKVMCDAQMPSIGMNVSSYIQWISDTLAIL